MATTDFRGYGPKLTARLNARTGAGTEADLAGDRQAMMDDTQAQQAQDFTYKPPAAGAYQAYVAGRSPNADTPLQSEAAWNDIQKAGWQAGKLGGTTQYAAQQTDAFKGLGADNKALTDKIGADQASQQAADAAKRAQEWSLSHAGQTGYSSVSDANAPSWSKSPGIIGGAAVQPAAQPAATGIINTGGASSSMAAQLGGTGSASSSMAAQIPQITQGPALLPAQTDAIRTAYNNGGIEAARAAATSFGVPAEASIESYATGTSTGDPKFGGRAVSATTASTQAATSQGATSATKFNAALPEHKAALADFAKYLQNLIGADGRGDAEAKALYKAKRAEFGFTNADFGPATAGMGELGPNGATPQAIAAWLGETADAGTTGTTGTTAATGTTTAATPIVTSSPAGTTQTTMGAVDPLLTANVTQPNGTTTTVAADPYNPSLTTPPAATTPAEVAPGSAAANLTSTAPGTAPVSTYSAQGVQTTGDMTVQGRVARLLDPNDPRNQEIMARVLEQMNGRGIINSSMAASGVTDAMIKNAVAIAQADAQTTAGNAQFSANASNQAGQFNAGAQNQANLQGNQQGYDAYKINALQDFNLQNMTTQQKNDLQKMATAYGFDISKMSTAQIFDLQKLSQNNLSQEKIAQLQADTSIRNTTSNNASSKEIAVLNSDTSKAIAKMNNDNQVLVNTLHDQFSQKLQTSAAEATAFRDLTNQILNIQMNDKMDGPAKTNAINNLVDLWKKSHGGTVPDYSMYLDFSNLGAATPDATAGGIINGASTDNTQSPGGS